MKVDIKKMEKVASIMEQIKTLDTEISKIEKYALLVANNKTKATINLTIGNIENNNTADRISMNYVEDSHASRMDYFDRFLRIEGSIFPFSGPSVSQKMTQKISTNKNNSITDELSENATIQILGIILGEKQRKIAGLITELEESGVKI